MRYGRQDSQSESWNNFHSRHHSFAYHFSCQNERFLMAGEKQGGRSFWRVPFRGKGEGRDGGGGGGDVGGGMKGSRRGFSKAATNPKRLKRLQQRRQSLY